MSQKSTESGLTNLDKIYWPSEGYSKGDLIAYYEKVAPYMLPYLKDRPITLHRQPNGIQDAGFFQKNVEKAPEGVSTVAVQHTDHVVHYIVINDLHSLLHVANLGCIEIHLFLSTIHHLDQPDFLLLDLDPEKIDFDAVVEVAKAIHELLESLQIKSYCKTSGATGLHILIPLGHHYHFNVVRKFAELLATVINHQLPEISSILRSPSKRQKKVYIDFMQNNPGQTLAAPYTVRPRPGATVSTPLKWSEVKRGLDPTSFTIKTIFKRLQKVGDLLEPLLKEQNDIRQALKLLKDLEEK